MLDKPYYGWTEISISTWKERASYLTDVPHDFLDAFNRLFKTRKPQCIYCDAEGWDYIIVFSFNEVYIIESKEKEILYSFEVNICSLSEELIKDMQDYIDLWVRWNDLYDIEDTKKEQEEKHRILGKIQQLKINLKKYKEN